MKALRLYGARDIRYEEAEKPVISSENDVIVKVKEREFVAQILPDIVN